MSDVERLLDVRDRAQRVVDLYADTVDVMRTDLAVRHDILFSIVMISAGLSAVSPAVMALAPTIPVRSIRQMRNLIVHEARAIDLQRIRPVVTDRLPALVRDIDALIALLGASDPTDD